VKDGLHLIASSVSGASLAAGMKVGDQIVKANGVHVITVEDLSTVVEAAPLSTGGVLEVDVIRGGVQKIKLKVFVDDRGREDKKKDRYLHV
jgi:S1-C subfamily serine protease